MFPYLKKTQSLLLQRPEVDLEPRHQSTRFLSILRQIRLFGHICLRQVFGDSIPAISWTAQWTMTCRLPQIRSIGSSIRSQIFLHVLASSQRNRAITLGSDTSYLFILFFMDK